MAASRRPELEKTVRSRRRREGSGAVDSVEGSRLDLGLGLGEAARGAERGRGCKDHRGVRPLEGEG